MARYFKNFPKVDYSLEKENQYEYVTSIVSRFGLEDQLKENTSAYYTYEVRDGDTPEILASKIYGSSEKHWVILMMNDMIDAQYDWPLTYQRFNEYVNEKYSTSEYADTANTGITGLVWSQNANNVYAYHKIVTKTTSSNTNIEKFEVDSNTYTNIIISTNNYTLQDGSTVKVEISKNTQNHYDYENELNESKRKIKILKTDFIPGLENELVEVFL